MLTHLPPDGVAQTNLQLFEQLRCTDLPTDVLERAAAGYRLVVRLFERQYRRTGKPCSAHLVGTASIALHAGGSSDVVLAALLHSAYRTGDFGYGGRGRSDIKRGVLRDAIGVGAEALVSAYTDRSEDPDVVLLGLAHDLEEQLDGGGGYGTDADRLLARSDEAEQLGYLDLSDALRASALDAGVVVAAPFRRLVIPSRPPTNPHQLRRLAGRARRGIRRVRAKR